MHPTDHMSTENKNEMKINKKTGIEQRTANKWKHLAIYAIEQGSNLLLTG